MAVTETPQCPYNARSRGGWHRDPCDGPNPLGRYSNPRGEYLPGLALFCLVDDRLKDWGPVRQRGTAPKLSDAEVLTIEIAARRALLHQAGVGARHVAPHQQAAAQSLLSHRSLLNRGVGNPSLQLSKLPIQQTRTLG